MSTVLPQPVPDMKFYDWAVVFTGLGMGIGTIFQIISWSIPESKKHRLYTWTNFWLIMSGVIHIWIEFNFVFFRSNSNIKTALDMYAAADWRYGDYGGLMESGTHAMEVITALIDGPLCFFVAWAAAHDYGCRHPFQIILCVMQLYGLLWFTLQPIYSETGVAGHFSSDPSLFWGIAVGCNAPWGIFPVILLYQSVVEVSNRLAPQNNKRD